MVRILDSFVLCRVASAVLAENDAWPPSVDPTALLRQHNIRRCMHGVPQLQWSKPLQIASQHVADNDVNWMEWVNQESRKPGFVNESNKTIGGFDIDNLGQSLWSVGYTPAPSPGAWWDPVQQLEAWYQEVEYSEEGITPDGCVTHLHSHHTKQMCAEYTQMVWQSTTYVGCGVWYADGPGGYADERRVSLVCAYGPGGNVDDAFEKQVLKLNGKSFSQCEKEVDSLSAAQPPLDPTIPTRVTISYTPPQQRLAASQQKGECIIAKYKLVFKEQPGKPPLALVAVDKDSNPCASHHYNKKDLRGWEWNQGGLFSDELGLKSCLMTDFSHMLMTNDDAFGSVPCTSINRILPATGGWSFNQQAVGKNLCMKEVPDAINGAWVVHDLPVLGFGDDCSSSWHMEVFEAPTQSDLPQQTTLRQDPCSACPAGLGNFACAPVAGSSDFTECRLAPTKSDCEAVGGEWCAKPPPGGLGHPVCANGTDDWQRNSKRRNCSRGCSYDICAQKMLEDTAVEHCYTQAQVGIGGVPRGCNYGTAENTCAYDEKDQCVYSDLGSLVAV